MPFWHIQNKTTMPFWHNQNEKTMPFWQILAGADMPNALCLRVRPSCGLKKRAAGLICTPKVGQTLGGAYFYVKGKEV